MTKINQVTIVETSPRDGLSMLLGDREARKKISYINHLSTTGLKKIECAAFVHPRIVPENADAEKVMAGIKKKPGVMYAGLIQTEVGCRRALATQVDEVLVQLAISDVFMKNFSGRTLKEALNNTFPPFFDAIKTAGRSIRIYVATAFGCPYIGRIPYDDVLQLVMKLKHMGADEIIIVDTAGMATPLTVKELFGLIIGLGLDVRIAAHFHDIRGLGLANCLAAYEAGVRIFDAALGGMSVTPYREMDLPLGYWNVPTEDLVYMFDRMGVETGIDQNALLSCVRLAEKYIKRDLPGHALRAASSMRLYKFPPVTDV